MEPASANRLKAASHSSYALVLPSCSAIMRPRGLCICSGRSLTNSVHELALFPHNRCTRVFCVNKIFQERGWLKTHKFFVPIEVSLALQSITGNLQHIFDRLKPKHWCHSTFVRQSLLVDAPTDGVLVSRRLGARALRQQRGGQPAQSDALCNAIGAH